MIECPNCGAMADESEITCRYCSHPLAGGTEESATNERFQGDAPHAPEPPPIDPPPERQTSTGGQQAYTQQPTSGQNWAPQQGYRPPYQQTGPQGQQYDPPQGRQPYGQPQYGPQPNPGYNQGFQYRDINKLAAGILAILLGGFGVHKFYMGRIGIGVLCVLFCWTGIPALIGFIEGIIYLCMDDNAFREKYAKRF